MHKNKIVSKIQVILILFMCGIMLFFMPKIKNVSANNSSEIVMEQKSLRVLYESNARKKSYMASTTKILTAITIIENCNLNDIVTIDKKTTGIEGSSIYLEEGEKLSVKDLLYGLMLRSGNDCAETLAVYCSKSIENFALLMNETAKKIGAVNSNFVNPHGLHNDNHYTTAYDLGLISCYAMNNANFREIVSTKYVKIPFTTRDTTRLLKNKNKILWNLDGSTGIKTGFTKKAGRCLVSSCLKNGIEVICVVLNCPPMFERSENLINNAINSYKIYKILSKKYAIDFIPVKNNKEKVGLIIKNDVYLPLTEQELKNIKIVYNYPDIIENNVNCNENIGEIQIYTQNNLIFSEKIYTIINVNI